MDQSTPRDLAVYMNGNPLRDSLAGFALDMEQQLAANAHKPGWRHMSFMLLHENLDQQAGNVIQIKMEMDRVCERQAFLNEQAQNISSMEEGSQIEARAEELTRQMDMLKVEFARKCANGANYFMMLASNFGVPLPPTPDDHQLPADHNT